MAEIIKLKDIYKHYRMGDHVVKAVDGINIDIEVGSFVAIMGPSGSGKSTSMNLVGSLDLASEGEIYLGGENIELFDESDLAQLRGKKIGFIFQQFNLIPNLTAKENIMLPMLFQNTDKEERGDRAEELLKLVELGDRGDHYPNQLSGGQQQRVAIARALANDPEVILADEPTGNLDTKTGGKMMDFLTKLNREGKTIIIVTHDADLAKNYAERIYRMVDGKIFSYEKKIKGKWKVQRQ
ncbi:MAG: ABC transporter ATP-binding protein [Candidatus Pacearchaeota archaeon]|nr:ABC transporter ATP-binding protein [Candidatus Pacearchaeota archaeon]